MKGVAVDQIILLVLGVIVLAVIGYLLYSNFMASSGGINTEQCKANLINVCNSCKMAQTTSGGWDPATYNDATVSTSHACNVISKSCIQLLAKSGIITVESKSFSGCSAPYCEGTTDTPLKMAQSVCANVGIG